MRVWINNRKCKRVLSGHDKNETLASEPIPVSHGMICINSARVNFHELCSGYSLLSPTIEMFTCVFGGSAESKIRESKRMAFNFEN